MLSVKIRGTILFLDKKFVSSLFLTLFLNPILFSFRWAAAVMLM